MSARQSAGIDAGANQHGPNIVVLEDVGGGHPRALHGVEHVREGAERFAVELALVSRNRETRNTGLIGIQALTWNGYVGHPLQQACG
jgi:hypothetical protein